MRTRRIKSRRHRRRDEDARRGRHLHRQGHRGQDGRPALRLADQQPRRHADEGADAPDPGDQGKVRYVGRPGRAWSWPRRVEQAQERGRGGRGRLRRAARGGRASPTRRRSRAASRCTTRRPTTSATSGRCGDKAAVDAAFAKAAHVTKLDLVNNRLIPNAIEPRVAIGSYSRGDRGVHALRVQPEPARRAPADDGLRARPARAQGARDRARRRRRLRLEDLPVRRGRRA